MHANTVFDDLSAALKCAAYIQSKLSCSFLHSLSNRVDTEIL